MTTEVNIGLAADDGGGDPLRTAFGLINTNFAEVVAAIALKEDIASLGDLAALDTVDTAQIDDEAITSAKIEAGAVGLSQMAETAVTPGAYTYASITITADGRIVSASSGTAPETLTLATDANTTIALGDAVANTWRLLTGGTAITATLDAQTTVGTKFALTPAGAGAVSIACESGAGFWLPGDNMGGSIRTTAFGLTGYGYFECIANSDGDSAEFVFIGASDHDVVFSSLVDFGGAGIEVPNGSAVSGTLTQAAHGGGVFVTSGNCSITPAAGFCVTLELGGAHEIDAGGTAHTGATGDIVTVLCFSATNVELVPVPAANVVNLPVS